MKALLQYLFLLAILLGFFTAYTLWHSEEVNPLPVTKNPKQVKVIEDLSPKNIIPKKILVVPTESLDNNSQEEDEKEMLNMVENKNDIPVLNLQEMESKTQDVYDSLIPEDYEETMQEAEAAFEALDAHIEALDAQLAEVMQDMEASQEEINTDIGIDDDIEEQN